MPTEAARAIWEVTTAGLIPGEADPTYTRRFGLTTGEYDGLEGDERAITLLGRFHQAVAYATVLHLLCSNGYAVNWVRIDFVWP